MRDVDGDLDRYLSYDIATTALCAPHVAASIAAAQQTEIYNLDVELARRGRSMARLGVAVDKQRRLDLALEYQGKANRLQAEFVALAGKDSATGESVNPRSYPQLKRLFYDRLGLPILEEFRTDTGEASTAEPVLISLLEMGLDARSRGVIHALLGYREADKLLGTYLGHPESNYYEGGLPAHIDGRMRVAWKIYGTPSGRWSSSPNAQNIPKKLRSMFVPAPGNVFVAADYSAVELRILALLANDQPLIDAFAAFDAGTGPDIHKANACLVFRQPPEAITDEARDMIKRYVYGLAYGAMPKKIYQTISLLRDEELRPLYPGISLSDIEHVNRLFWQGHPAIQAWRKALISGWRRLGYIATPWHGRRRYFVGGEDHEQMYNHPIQGAAADLQNSAVLKLTAAYPFDYPRNRGLILQVHDQLVVECGEDEAEKVAGMVAGSMETQIGPMRFPAKAKIGRDWKAVS